MFTEYIFENKKYELAVRDLKATLFDIVAIEEAKLSSIEEKVEGEYKPERKEELRNLCSQQDECLKKVLTISNQLSEALIKLDSYSKSLKELEDENIAEIIASMGDRRVQKAYQKDLKHGQSTIDDIADEMISKVDEITDSELLKNQMMDSIETIKEGPVLEKPTPVGEVRVVSSEAEVKDDIVDEVVDEEVAANEESSIVVPENVEVPVEVEEAVQTEVPTEVVPTAEEPVNEEVIASEETPAIVPENAEVPVEVGETVQTEIPTEVVPTTEEPVNEEVIASEETPAITSENVEIPVDVEETVQPEIPTEDVPTAEEVTNGEVIASEETPAITSENVEIPVDVEETVQPEIPIEDVPTEMVVNENDVMNTNVLLEPSNENIQASVEVPSSDNNSIPEQSDSMNKTVSMEGDDLNSLEAVVDRQAELNDENKEIVKDSQIGVIQKLKFIKSSNAVAKAILTSRKQITNLRNSRVVQESLLKVRGSIGSNIVANNTFAAVSDNLESEKAIEQQLINNGLLEATAVDKQRQIEQMLEQANALYKEGRLDEAQSMYDQISILNKELQQESAVVK